MPVTSPIQKGKTRKLPTNLDLSYINTLSVAHDETVPRLLTNKKPVKKNKLDKANKVDKKNTTKKANKKNTPDTGNTGNTTSNPNDPSTPNKPRPVCTTCGRSFSKPANRKAHERIHTGEKRYSCDICQKRFVWKSSLNFHSRTAHIDKGSRTEAVRSLNATTSQVPAPTTPTTSETPVPEAPTTLEAPLPTTPTTLEAPLPNAPTQLEAPLPTTPTPLEEPLPTTPTQLEAPLPTTPTPLEEPLPTTPTPLEAPAANAPMALEVPAITSPTPESASTSPTSTASTSHMSVDWGDAIWPSTLGLYPGHAELANEPFFSLDADRDFMYGCLDPLNPHLRFPGLYFPPEYHDFKLGRGFTREFGIEAHVTAPFLDSDDSSDYGQGGFF